MIGLMHMHDGRLIFFQRTPFPGVELRARAAAHIILRRSREQHEFKGSVKTVLVSFGDRQKPVRLVRPDETVPDDTIVTLITSSAVPEPVEVWVVD